MNGFDFGHAFVLLMILVGGFLLWKNPGKPAEPNLRRFAWGVLILFAVVWLGWAFGCWPHLAR